MRSLIVLSVIFAVSFAAPHGLKEVGSNSGHARKRSYNHGAAFVEPARFYTASVNAPPAGIFLAPSAVSHQSREDIRTSQTIVSGSPVIVASAGERIPSPVLVSPVQVYQAPSVYAIPAKNVYPGTAISHQSRLDSRTSSIVVSPQIAHQAVVQSVVEDIPVVGARSVYVSPASASLYQPTVYGASW